MMCLIVITESLQQAWMEDSTMDEVSACELCIDVILQRFLEFRHLQ